jgi:ABC-type dipeptide/oligopeptide/nickel transport system permease subunit
VEQGFGRRGVPWTVAQYIVTAPWILIFPGLAITVTVLGFAFAGDTLRDIFDPRLQGR